MGAGGKEVSKALQVGRSGAAAAQAAQNAPQRPKRLPVGVVIVDENTGQTENENVQRLLRAPR